MRQEQTRESDAMASLAVGTMELAYCEMTAVKALFGLSFVRQVTEQ